MLRLFIVGCPRSGTTLLQSLLAAHPALVSAPESHAFNLLRERRLYRAPKSLGLYQAFQSHMAQRHPGIRLPDAALGDDAFATAFLQGMDDLASSQCKRGWLEKTPDHLHCIATIRETTPDAWFIHVLRDPRDTIASLLEAAWQEPDAWGGDKDLEWAADKWNTAMAASSCWEADAKHLFIDYGSLCTRTETVLADLQRALGLAPVGGTRIHAGMTEGIILPDEPWKAHNRDPVGFRALSKFRRLFTPAERLVASGLVERQAARFYHRNRAGHAAHPLATYRLPKPLATLARRLSGSVSRRAHQRFLEKAHDDRALG